MTGIFSPFPYWQTFFILSKHVLFDRNPANLSAKWKQATFLIRHLLVSPLWMLLWYLDEILYPAYRRYRVNPIFIIGEPRCGTTLLHRTLGADIETFFATRHVEWRYPFIFVQRLIHILGLSKRLKRSSYWPNTASGKEASRMHPNNLYDFEEDGIFFEERFLHHFFIFLRFPYPALLAYLDSYPTLPTHIQQRMLTIHRRTIQKIAFLRGNPSLYYLSKEVTSHNKIPHLIELYPEARFILIVRSASAFMDSLLALVQQSTMTKTGIDPLTIPGWEVSFRQRMQQDTELLVELCECHIDGKRQIRVSYQRFVDNIVDTVQSIYAQLGQTPSPAYLTHLANLQIQQRQRERGYTYRRQSLAGFERYEQFVHQVETFACHKVTLASSDNK